MKNTKLTSITAILVIAAMIAGCATPQGAGGMAQSDPCQPGGGSAASFSPQNSFLQQAILSPLANIGGTLLATAAANYSEKYTGKLNKFLTKLVTPKKKKKKKPAPVDPGQQPGFGFEDPIDPNTGFPIQDPSEFPGQDDFGQGQEQIDPNTGFPIQDPSDFPGQDDFAQGQEQIDPNTGLPFQDPSGFPEEEAIDPNTGLPIDQGFVEGDQFQEGFPQEEFQPAVEDNIGEFDPSIQGEIQSRGVPGQAPHARFPGQPCDPQQQNQQGYPQANQPYENDPYQSGGYDPYAQQQEDPYGQQGYQDDPYGQQQDPYGQQDYQDDPYDQQAGQDPYGQQEYQDDPYGQQQDPYGQQGYQDDPYGQQAGQAPYAQQDYSQDGTAIGNRIGLDVVMLKKTIRNGAVVMVPIKDGDVLKDGRGNVKAGDKFRIMFRPHTDGYVYVVAIDGSGWAQGIFPPSTSPLANPVKAGEQYVLPEGNNWFSLDQFKGVETMFFVASQDKRQDLEEVLQSISGQERPATATPQQVTKVAMVPYGVGGARPSAQGFNLSSGAGPGQTIMPTSYFSKTAGEDLRLTRWFRHE